MLEGYRELKSETAALVEAFGGLADALGDAALAEGARRRRERLEADELHLAAVSEFSNGKSTLINALLGCDLLPTHRRPFTATVIRIVYGPEPEVRIAFRDGRQALCTPGEGDLRKVLNHFCTTLTDQAREVEEVVVRYPLPLCRHGLVLLDTPGLESVYDPHDRVARRVLAAADAVLFVVEAGKVGRIADLKLVQQLKFIRKEAIFFALNKIDQLRSPGEVQEAVEELRGMLRGIIDAPRIYPVSGLYALQARLLRAGSVSPRELARDRRLLVPDGEKFRPVRRAADWEALEAASGLGVLEADIEAFLTSGERAREALKGASLYVAGRLLEAVLPNVRRLRAALEKGDGGSLAERVARGRDEVAAARAEMDALLAAGGRLDRAGEEIWAEAVERRTAPAALDRLVEGIDRSLAAKGLRELDRDRNRGVWAAVDYAVKRLCTEAEADLRARWSAVLADLQREAAGRVGRATARVEAHLDLDGAAAAAGGDAAERTAGASLPAPAGAGHPSPSVRPASAAEAGLALGVLGGAALAAAAAVAWPAGLIVGALGGLVWKGFRAEEHLRQQVRERAREAAREAVARARPILTDLHRRYGEAIRAELQAYYGETLSSLEANLARLEQALAEHGRREARLRELERLEAQARSLLERAKALVARLEGRTG